MASHLFAEVEKVENFSESSTRVYGAKFSPNPTAPSPQSKYPVVDPDPRPCKLFSRAPQSWSRGVTFGSGLNIPRTLPISDGKGASLPLIVIGMNKILPLLATCLLLAPAFAQDVPSREISSRIWHLGDDETPEWPEAPAKPDGGSLSFEFQASARDGSSLLAITHRHISNDWRLAINGIEVARLKNKEPLDTYYYELPAAVLQDGVNTASLTGSHPTDDITFGPVTLHEGSFREVFKLRHASVTVTDESGFGLPARVTITDSDGELVPTYYSERLETAVRNGVIYTSSGLASFEVPVGEYLIQAARGTEWSMASGTLVVGELEQPLHLQLTRELELATLGFVAADTHIHTLTHSGHGDSSVEERMVTLAGEGVELAIATDHNHNTDYTPTQAEMGLGRFFTPAIGNEVSTPVGHLNAFPLRAEDEVPPHDLQDIEAIVSGIRERGALAVILNHPRWPDHAQGPHGTIELDGFSGEWSGNWAVTFDALELINSQTKELEPMLLFRDWFALLNRGERVFAVGSSDSHTVGGVVGQGRTYVQSSTDDPGAIDVNETALNIANGHSSISMGIVATVLAGGEPAMGKTLGLQDTELHIAAPSWVSPTKLIIFANGQPILEQPIDAVGREAFTNLNIKLPTTLAWPAHDFHMVAVVEGAGVQGKFWPQINNYTLAATNPIFFDVDGDGKYSNPRALAQSLVRERGTEDAIVSDTLNQVDSAVAIQYMRLVRQEFISQAERRATGLSIRAREKHPTLIEWMRSLLGKK